MNSPQIFQHTFPGNQTLTLSADISKVPVRMVVTPLGLAIKYPDEYEKWVREVVSPTLMAAVSEEVKIWFAERGMKKTL